MEELSDSFAPPALPCQTPFGLLHPLHQELPFLLAFWVTWRQVLKAQQWVPQVLHQEVLLVLQARGHSLGCDS